VSDEFYVPLPQGISQAHDKLDTPLRTFEHAKHKLSECTDLAWLHLGSVYEMLNIEQNIVDQYCLERQKDVTLTCNVMLPRAIVGGLKQWDCMIQAVPQPWFSELNLWLLNLLFVKRSMDRAMKAWWRPRHCLQNVPDPYCNDPGQTAPVHFYLPFGNVGRTEINYIAQMPVIEFRRGVAPPIHTVPTGL
jgi:hypothetical protein